MPKGVIIRNDSTGVDTFLEAESSGLVLVSDPSYYLGLKFANISQNPREETWSFNTLNFSASAISGQTIIEMFVQSGSGKTAKLIKARTSYRINVEQGTAALPIPPKVSLVRTGVRYSSGIPITAIAFDTNNTSISGIITCRNQSSGGSVSGIISSINMGNKGNGINVNVDQIKMVYNLYDRGSTDVQQPVMIYPGTGVAIRITAGPVLITSTMQIEGEFIFTVA